MIPGQRYNTTKFKRKNHHHAVANSKRFLMEKGIIDENWKRIDRKD
tara:strand:- start:1736 stop:1873 length:138 start_codon:yes stop_codon:yes gene_type:complete